MRTAYMLLTVAAAMICAALLVAFATSPACAQGGGKALDFDGTDDYVTISSVLSTSTTEATFEAWIYPELFTEFQDHYCPVISRIMIVAYNIWFLALCNRIP